MKLWQNSSDYYLLRKTKGYDLFACEAQYHRSCHEVNFRKPTYLSMNFDLKLQQLDMEDTHKDAFTKVCAIADNKLIKEGGISKLSDVRELYEKTPAANLKYRSDNLKAKLVKCYNEHLSFVQLGRQGRYQSSLMHKSSVDTGSLIRMTYKLSSTDRLSKMARQ